MHNVYNFHNYMENWCASDEWENFLARIGRDENAPDSELSDNQNDMLELRFWASYRGQTLARTGKIFFLSRIICWCKCATIEKLLVPLWVGPCNIWQIFFFLCLLHLYGNTTGTHSFESRKLVPMFLFACLCPPSHACLFMIEHS